MNEQIVCALHRTSNHRPFPFMRTKHIEQATRSQLKEAMKVLDQISICFECQGQAEPRSDQFGASLYMQGQAEYFVTRPNSHMVAKLSHSYVLRRPTYQCGAGQCCRHALFAGKGRQSRAGHSGAVSAQGRKGTNLFVSHKRDDSRSRDRRRYQQICLVSSALHMY